MPQSMPSSAIRARRLKTASRERRHACSAEPFPIISDRLVRGSSISNCTSAVVAAVEPLQRAAPVDADDRMPSRGQRLCHHGADDAHADDRDIGFDVSGQRPGRHRRRAVGEPDRSAGPEVELAGHECLRKVDLNACGARVPRPLIRPFGPPSPRWGERTGANANDLLAPTGEVGRAKRRPGEGVWRASINAQTFIPTPAVHAAPAPR